MVKGKIISKQPVEEVEPTVDSSEGEDNDENDGVDEAGMKRLMDLLGDDGLDDFASAQLEALGGSEGEEGEDDDASEAEDDAQKASGSEAENDVSEDEDEGGVENDEEQEEEAEEEEIALDDASSVDEDAVPRQKIVINNQAALQRIRETIKLDPSFTWTETLSLTYPEPLGVKDPDNDLERELAFYKQALHGANTARDLALKHSLPFTRPPDFFAEMVKSDAHMERIRQKLLDETAGIKKSEDAKRQRELKKFGKQVQVEKLKERVQNKKEMEERLKSLKRKRGKGGLEESGAGEDEAFDIAVEDAIADQPSSSSSHKRAKTTTGAGGADSSSSRGRGGPKRGMPRSARDSKFGYGGKGKREKQNTRESTNDFSGGHDRESSSSGRRGGGARGGRGGGGGRGGFRGGRGGARGGGAKSTHRPGKSRRQAGRS